MLPFFSQALDRLVIRLAAQRQPPGGRFPARVTEAKAVLAQPDFFGGAVSLPENVQWTSATDFHFPSGVDSPWLETKTVHGRLFRCGADWASRPTVILIHGWNEEWGYTFRHPVLVRQFQAAGINTAMIELPYHLQRRPRGPKAVDDFLSEDLCSNMRATQQAIADIRALLAWLSAQGCSRLGLWGVSLGGWLGGLVACHDVRVRLAVLQIPAARMDRVIEDLEFCAPVRRGLQGAAFDFSRLNLRSHRPQVPRHNILLIEAEDDLFVKRAAVEELWMAWDKPEIWRVRHGHISILLSRRLARQAVDWVVGKAADI